MKNWSQSKRNERRRESRNEESGSMEQPAIDDIEIIQRSLCDNILGTNAQNQNYLISHAQHKVTERQNAPFLGVSLPLLESILKFLYDVPVSVLGNRRGEHTDGLRSDVWTCRSWFTFMDILTAPHYCSLVTLLNCYESGKIHPRLGGCSNDVGIATVFVSHSWDTPVVELVQSLREYVEYYCQQNEQVFIWIAGICVNNHANYDEKSIFKKLFSQVISTQKTVVSVGNSWENISTFSRAWCQYELVCAIKYHKPYYIIVTASDTAVKLVWNHKTQLLQVQSLRSSGNHVEVCGEHVLRMNGEIVDQQFRSMYSSTLSEFNGLLSDFMQVLCDKLQATVGVCSNS